MAAELSRPDTGRTLYLLDEPTTGLHFDDLAKLLEVLNRLVDLGNTVVVIEHNLDVIKTADWIIEMGPEAGDEGGIAVVSGTPEVVARYATSAANNGKTRVTTAKKVAKKATPAKTKKAASTNKNQEHVIASGLRSYTGEALASVLAADPYVQRATYDPAEIEKPRDDDREIEEVSGETKMPWEADGRLWHTQDCVDRKGNPVQWDGRILAEVVDRIHNQGAFSGTNWTNRSIVEISGETKSDGWFLHAITAETWLVKMKFRVAKNTFKRDKLQEQLNLKTLNQMEELPIYGNDSRVKCKNLRGPWQEIEVRCHSWEEVDTPEFWQFIDKAVEGFHTYINRLSVKADDIMPWKKLGRKWHFNRKGFPPSQLPKWDMDVLEELCEMLDEVAADGQFLWNNQQIVNLFVPGQKAAWAAIRTKKPECVELTLNCKKDLFAFGELTEIGVAPDLDTTPSTHDLVRLRFVNTDQIQSEVFADVIRRHHDAALSKSSE